MTGDAPQPGETPRDEGNPWSYAEAGGSWWHAEPDRPAGLDAGFDPGDDAGTKTRRARRRPPQNAAAAQTSTLLPPRPPRTEEETRAYEAAAEDVAAELAPVALESHHDQLDDFRYDPLNPPAPPSLISPPSQLSLSPPLQASPPSSLIPPSPIPPEMAEIPDVVILPEPPAVKERPTVPIPARSPIDDIRIEKLENSPFWQYDQNAAARPAGPTHQARGNRKTPRHAIGHPAVALLTLVTLGLLATFFAWVSAEPFWLAVGHGSPGTATVSRCTGTGVAQRCTGTFASADGRITVNRVRLLGVAETQRTEGSAAPARMVSADSRQAYLGGTGTLLQLRWILGFALVLLCGYGIAGLTGARRLETPAARRGATLISVAGPLALLAGFLLATY